MRFTGQHIIQRKAGAGRPWFGAALAALSLVALAACSEEGALSREPSTVRGTQLAQPKSLTPPVYVGEITGAPGNWKLRDKVADALRQRDIPAGSRIRGRSAYVLRGRIDRQSSNGQYGQYKVRWTLFDPSGKKVGQVTQVAAIPRATINGKNDDVVDAIADAAAESMAPIVPSSRLQTAQNRVTGLKSPETRKKVEAANPVSAIGKLGKNSSPLSRNLLRKPDNNREPVTPSRTRPANDPGNKTAMTAIGRLNTGRSALSRNLLRGRKTTTRSHTEPRVSTFRRATTRRTAPPADNAPSSTTSNAPARPAAPVENAPPGSMTELFLRYPTSTERRARTSVRPAPRATRTAPPVSDPRDGVTVTKDVTPPATRTTRPVRARPTVRRPGDRNLSRGRARREIRSSASGRLYWINLGSHRTRAVSRSQWRRLQGLAPTLLASQKATIRKADLGPRGVFYRIQIGPYETKPSALNFCSSLKRAQLDCFLVSRRVQMASLPAKRTTSRKRRAHARSVIRPAKRSTRSARRRIKTYRARKTVRTTNIVTRRPAKRITPPPATPATPAPAKDKRPPLSTSPGIPSLLLN